MAARQKTSLRTVEIIRRLDSKPYFRLLVIVVILMIVSGAYLLFNNYRQNSLILKPYLSASYHFRVGFPTSPKLTSASETISGQKVTATKYLSSFAGQGYNLEVFTFPDQLGIGKLDRSQQSTLLSAATEGTFTLIFRATVNSVSTAQFHGYPATQVTFTKDRQVGYAEAFLKGLTEYMLYTQGASRAHFNKFTNSFRFD